MQYARCKCGSMEMWTSGMPLTKCARCEKCGSGYAYGPSSHEEPLPHDFSEVEKVNTDEGEKTLTHCRYCHRTKAQIEKREQQKAEKRNRVP